MRNVTASREAAFRLDGIPPAGMAVSMVLQHLVSMIVGCVTPAIIIANTIPAERECEPEIKKLTPEGGEFFA